MELNILITVFSLLMFHYFSDFILQTRVDAENKSSSLFHLSRHVFTYSLAMTGYAWIFFLFSPFVAFASFLFFFVIHWIIDYYTSRASSKAYKAGKNEAFWRIIGIDQLLHQLHLIVYLYLLWKII